MCVQGVKEVTLLGQNVNSYRDLSERQFSVGGSSSQQQQQLSRGFQTVYHPRPGGLRFSHLLDRVSRIDPDMRIRFTSPHPKDFPDEVRGSPIPYILPSVLTSSAVISNLTLPNLNPVWVRVWSEGPYAPGVISPGNQFA